MREGNGGIFLINSFDHIHCKNIICKYWWYGISNGLLYLLIVLIPLILFGPKDAFCGWFHCQG